MAVSQERVANLPGSAQTAGDKIPQHVQIVDTSGNVISSFGGSGGTAQADGTAFTANTTSATPVMGVYESTPTTLTDGDVGVFGLTANREVKVSVTSGGTSGTQYTEGDTDATITGTAILFETNTGTSAVGVVSSATPLPVQLGDGTDLATVRDVTGAKALDVSIVDGSGNQVTSFGGGTQYTEGDADATLTGTVALAEGPSNVATPLQVDASGHLQVDIAAASAVPVTDNGGSLTVDGTVAVSGTVAVTDNSGSLTIDNAALSVTGGGLEASALRVTLASDSTGVVSVDDNGSTLSIDDGGGAITVDGTVTVSDGGGSLTVDGTVAVSGTVAVTDNAGSLTVDNAGTFAVQAAQSGSWTGVGVVGNAAHDAAVSGNPVLVGAEGRSSDGTSVTSGDVVRLLATLLGKQVTYPWALPGSTWSYAAASGGITNTTGVTAKAAAGAGVRNYITQVQAINGHASTGTDVQIRDGASGTVLWRGWAQPSGGGCAAKFDPPLRGTANTLVEVACGTTGTATYVNLQGFTSAE